MRVPFASITYVCLYFIEVIVLAPSSVCFLLPPHIYLHVLSSICMFSVIAMSSVLRVEV